MKVAMIAIAAIMMVGLLATPVRSQTIEASLKCDRTIPTGTEYSDGGAIRVDQAFICVRGADAFLHYRASAMRRASYTGRSQSPWLSLKILDRAGVVLFESKTFDLPDVARCGGEQGHWKTVPIGDKVVAIHSFELSMSGTRGKPCANRTPWDRLTYDVKTTAERWSKGQLTDSEKAILAVAAGSL